MHCTLPRHCYISATAPPHECHDTAALVPWHCRINATTLPHQCHDTVASVPRHCRLSARRCRFGATALLYLYYDAAAAAAAANWPHRSGRMQHSIDAVYSIVSTQSPYRLHNIQRDWSSVNNRAISFHSFSLLCQWTDLQSVICFNYKEKTTHEFGVISSV